MDVRSLWARLRGAPSGSGSAGGDAGDLEPEHDPAAADGQPILAAGAGAGPGASARPARPAWRDAPPIPRTVKAAPLTAPTVPFSHELSGHQAPPLALEVLGHELRADGPAGIVGNLVTPRHGPVEAAESGSLRASVRASAGAGKAHASEDAHQATGAPRLAGSRALGIPTQSSTAASSPELPAIAPVSRPIVARSTAPAAGSSGATDRVRPAPLVSAPPTSRAPAGVIGRAQAAGSALRPATVTAVAEATAASSARSAPPVASATLEATGTDVDAALPAPARRNLGQTRRLRIGAPIDTKSLDPRVAAGSAGDADATAPGVVRSSEPGVLAVRGARPTVDGDADADASPSPSTGGAPARAGAGDAPGVESVRADAAISAASAGRPETGAGRPMSTRSTIGVAATPVPARPIAPAPRPATVPLVGRLAVGSSGRAAARGASPTEPARPATATPTGRFAAATPGGRPSVQDVLGALAAGAGPTAAGSPKFAPGSAVTSVSTGSFVAEARELPAGVAAPVTLVARSGPGQAEPATSLTTAAPLPGSLRRIGSIGPAWSSPAPARSSGAGAGAAAGRTVAMQRASAAGPRDAAPSGAASSIESGSASATTDEPALELLVSESPVQRAYDDGAAMGVGAATGSWAGLATSPIVSREDAGAAPAPGGAGAGPSDKELDELAKKLFPRMQLRLRTELLVDRERIGALADMNR